MPLETRGTNQLPLQILSKAIQDLLLLAKEGRWDDFTQTATETQDIFHNILRSNLHDNANKEKLAETLNSCEHLKQLCLERHEQIAPLVEKLERSQSHGG